MIDGEESRAAAMRRLVSRMLTPAQKKRIKAFVSKQFNIIPRAGLKSKCELPYKVLVGTHHKTGSVWLRSIFQAICTEYSLRFFAGEQAEATRDYDVFFQDHSRFDLDLVGSPIRGLHIIRDPRDVILSGCFYHQKSDEKWLHTPRTYLSGRTYHEAINGADTLQDKISFEMENAGRHTIEEIMKWDYTVPSFCELKYEDLIRDTALMVFHRAFSFLGFPGSALPGALAIAYSKSLFSNQVKPSDHIRSGEVGQWKQYFTRKHKERFLELFGDVLIRLGYEDDDGWCYQSRR
jgi:hypothetical protein